MESTVKFIVALLLPILLLSGRARSQCINGCACFPFSAPVTMDCTPRPDVTGVDTLFTYIPAGAAATINRMWVNFSAARHSETILVMKYSLVCDHDSFIPRPSLPQCNSKGWDGPGMRLQCYIKLLHFEISLQNHDWEWNFKPQSDQLLCISQSGDSGAQRQPINGNSHRCTGEPPPTYQSVSMFNFLLTTFTDHPTPSTLDGNPLMAIEDGAFGNLTTLEQLWVE